MKSPKLTILGLATAGLMAMVAMVGKAQGPLYDKVIVDLPYSVTINERTLQPGEYVIRQNSSPGGGSRVLHIYSDDGMKLETTVMTIPALKNRTPEETQVVLHHIGPDYYFDKIWIQGKNYGYEFVLPDSVKARERERMQPATVVARYEAAPAEEEVAATPAPPAPEPAPAPAPAPRVEERAEVTPPPAPAQPEVREEAAPAPAPPAYEEREQVAARQMPREMPRTAANWLTLLLGGSALAGAGLALRRLSNF